jgi:hypothetical protein
MAAAEGGAEVRDGRFDAFVREAVVLVAREQMAAQMAAEVEARSSATWRRRRRRPI